MKEILNYNFIKNDIKDHNFHKLYVKRRRDSIFAFVFEDKDNNIYAIRDHLGIVPLYFRQTKKGTKFSHFMSDLVLRGDKINKKGLLSFIATGTAKLFPLIHGIKIVPPGTVLKINSDSVSTIYSYKISPVDYLDNNESKIISKLDFLMNQAVKRSIKEKEVGLYLSGGMDSGLVGHYLKKNGVIVNGYTSSPWGEMGTEVKYAKMNAKFLGIDNHKIIPLETRDYKSLSNSIVNIYNNPHGTTTALGVIDLWNRSSLKNEKQIYFAQNADTINCAMPSQYLSYFFNFLPKFLQKKASLYFGRSSLLKNYVAFVSKGLLEKETFLEKYKNNNLIDQIVIAGMLFGHTPSDSEVLYGPCLVNNIIFSNPFYDMDLIEYSMGGIPWYKKFSFSNESRIKLRFEKNMLRKLAVKYLPKELVYRKKGFTIPMERDSLTKRFNNSLPHKINNIVLESSEHKFSAFILKKWLRKNLIKIEL